MASQGYFSVERGERQGDPLSPLLFILDLEVLSCSIRQKEQIQGIKIGKEEIELTIFADDMSCFLKNSSSYAHLCQCLEKLFFYSGLKVNAEKTEFLRPGLKKTRSLSSRF